MEELNNVNLNGRHFLQTKGCAIGTISTRLMLLYVWEDLKRYIHTLKLTEIVSSMPDTLMTYS